MTAPLWISIAIGIAWSIVNSLWSVFLVRMENRLTREFVRQTQFRDWCEDLERRLRQVGA
jgi:hypothetical protein